jgi:spore coat protein H
MASRELRDRTLCILISVFLLIFVLGCENKNSSDTDASAGELLDARAPATVAIQNRTVFAQNQMLKYYITIDANTLKDMDANGIDEQYREASLRVVGNGVDARFDKVGFRYKGAWSLHHCWDDYNGVRNKENECERLSTKIKFDKYDEDARFFGLKRLNLHAMMGDGSKLRERLAYNLFNAFGVTTSRTAHAKLYVNNVYSGLVIAVEPIDGRFTHFRYPEGGDGNLFKEIWPSQDVIEKDVYDQLKTNEKPKDNPNVTDFLAFKDAIARSTVDTFENEMASQINIDEILRYIAVDRAIRNWDGIMGFYSSEAPHNFYWYHDDGPVNRFHLIPWDLDNTIQASDFVMDPPQGVCGKVVEPMPDWNVTPLNCDARSTCMDDHDMTPPRCDHFIDMLATTQWDAFVAVGNELLRKVFTVEAMDARITKWAAQIRSAVHDDPLVEDRAWDAEVAALRYNLRDAVYDFREHINEGLIAESTPIPPNEDQLKDPIDAGRLRVEVANNFEFGNATNVSLDKYIDTYGSFGTELKFMWNNDTPIMGNGDLLLSANIVRKQGGWTEYGAFVYPTETPIDLSPYTYMWFNASANTSADKDTQIRIDFLSDNYQEYGDVMQLFSKEFFLTTEAAMYRVDIAKLEYPQWAIEEWEVGDGWRDDMVDAEALKHILQKFTGIAVQLFPHSNDSGDMIEATELITVNIDNIYFE